MRLHFQRIKKASLAISKFSKHACSHFRFLCLSILSFDLDNCILTYRRSSLEEGKNDMGGMLVGSHPTKMKQVIPSS